MIYKVTHRATGAEITRYAAMAPVEQIDDLAVPFSDYDHTELPEDGVIDAPIVAMTWTKLEYLRRFTQTERIAIREAAKVSPELEDYMQLLELATEVRSDDPDIAAALGMLEAVGLIGPGRAAEIIAEPVTEAPVETPAFVITHRVTMGGIERQACVDPDGTVRFEDGKWTTLDSLAAMSATVEVI